MKSTPPTRTEPGRLRRLIMRTLLTIRAQACRLEIVVPLLSPAPHPRHKHQTLRLAARRRLNA